MKKQENEEMGKKTKVWKILLGIVLCILAVYIIFVVRNFFIINTYQLAMIEYEKSNNYYAKVNNYQGNMVSQVETYYLNGKSLTKMQPSQTRMMLSYIDEQTGEHILRIDADGDKVAIVKQEKLTSMKLSPVSGFGIGNDVWQNLFLSMMTQISTEECNGKECYLIKSGELKIWIDKDTFLTVRIMNGLSRTKEESTSIVTDYQYVFGNVLEEQVSKPDLTGYKVEND